MTHPIPRAAAPRPAAAPRSVLASAVAAPVVAHTRRTRSSGGELWPQDAVLEFRWRPGAEPPADLRTAIRGGGGRRQRHAATARRRRSPTTRAGRASIGYGPGATCGVNGIACFTRSAPGRRLHDVAARARPRLRLGRAALVPACGAARRTAATTPRRSRSTSSATSRVLGHHDNHADDRDYLDAVVQTVSRTKPREGWDMHVFGRCDVATLQLRYDVPTTSAKVSTCLALRHRPDPRRRPDLDRLWRRRPG